MQMWAYIVRRLLLVVPVILGVMTITFVLTSAVPHQERCISYFGPPPIHNTGGALDRYNAHCASVLGLNQPVPVQWGLYVYHSLTFQWGVVGNSSRAVQVGGLGVIAGQPVVQALAWLLPYTIELALLALAFILIIAVPLGRLSAVYRNRPIDQASRVMSFSGYAIPPFLLGSLVVIAIVLLVAHNSSPCGGAYTQVVGSWPVGQCMAGWSPGNNNYPPWIVSGVISTPTGFPTVDAALHGQWMLAGDTILRIVLPALIIAFTSIAILLRFVRNSMLEVMNLDFVRTARAKGVAESGVVRRHAGRNSLNVTITVLGLTFAFFIGGFPIIEEVFGLWGVGRILALSVQQPYDFGLIFGSTILFTFIVVFANLIVDIVYAVLDPRVRLG